MQFYDFIAEPIRELATNFRHPEYLWGIPIAFFIVLILATRNLVPYGLDEVGYRKLRRTRVIVIILRSLALALLFVALATPFTTISRESEGNPRALVLIDESASMDLYDTSFTEFLTKELQQRLPTTVKTFGSEIDSPIGDAALGHPEHLLLITDGNANAGVALEDAAQVAHQNNLTISAITLSPLTYDAAVTMDVPQSVPIGFPARIRVIVTATNSDPVPLTVYVDDTPIYNQLTIGEIELNPELPAGYHRIEARIAPATRDARVTNNAHYRVIETLERPKVLVLSAQQGPLEGAIRGLFDATVTQSLPQDLAPYTAIVINDRNAASVGNAARIADFLRDEQGGKLGNGLVVIGGFNSYDRGSYQGTQLESLLPVKVGRPKRELGDNSLVFVIQISGSTTGTRVTMVNGVRTEITDTVPVIDIIKAQAVSAIESLNLQNKVGVIVFGASTEGESYESAEELIASSVVKVANVAPLHTNKKEIVDKISRLQGGGTTAPDLALRAAVDELKARSGSRTIIFLTNGRFSAGLGDVDAGAKSQVASIIENAHKQYGIKTHVIGVGSNEFDAGEFKKRVDEDYLVGMAVRSDGLYDRATNMARLMLEYGDPDEKGFGDEFQLVTLSLTHFITRDLELTAVLNGYNEVAPKDGSRILVKTDGGMPALTTWNYFNGRVAALTVFTGSGIGPLLTQGNSDLLRNTIMWAVGDPRRKHEVTVDITPAIAGQKAEVTFTSASPISGSCPDTPIAFERSSGNTYVFSFTPEAIGFGTVCDVPYAVNNPSEHWRVGISPQLAQAVAISGGEMFTFDEIDKIVERIRTVSTRVVVEKTELRSPFIALAIILFLIEIFIRRLTRYRS